MDDNKPCMGCEDRVPGCSDHCQKPHFLRWRARLNERHRRAALERDLTGYQVGEIRKNRRK